MTPLVSITVWRVGAGSLRCVPRVQRRYVVAPRRGAANAWAVWRETGAGHADLVDDHVSVELDASGAGEAEAEAERADVLRLGVPGPAVVDRAMARYPGCLVALAPDSETGGCVAGTRDGTRVAAAPVTASAGSAGSAGSHRPMTGDERGALASFLHAQLVLGERWTAASGSLVLAIHAVHGRTEHAPLWVRLVALTRVSPA